MLNGLDQIQQTIHRSDEHYYYKMEDTKYTVYKTDELNQDVGFYCGVQPIPDAVVIRTQDRFAATALETYAAICSATAEMIAEVNGNGDPRYIELMNTSDYFMHKAMEAAHGRRKFPDD